MSILFHFPTEVSDLIFFETVDTLFYGFFAYYFLGGLNAVFRGFISQCPGSCLRLPKGFASPPVEFLPFFAGDDFSGAFLIDLWMTARCDGWHAFLDIE